MGLKKQHTVSAHCFLPIAYCPVVYLLLIACRLSARISATIPPKLKTRNLIVELA
jgi:hypothetical protein